MKSTQCHVDSIPFHLLKKPSLLLATRLTSPAKAFDKRRKEEEGEVEVEERGRRIWGGEDEEGGGWG